jgi:hypothetical protein
MRITRYYGEYHLWALLGRGSKTHCEASQYSGFVNCDIFNERILNNVFQRLHIGPICKNSSKSCKGRPFQRLLPQTPPISCQNDVYTPITFVCRYRHIPVQNLFFECQSYQHWKSPRQFRFLVPCQKIVIVSLPMS